MKIIVKHQNSNYYNCVTQNLRLFYYITTALSFALFTTAVILYAITQIPFLLSVIFFSIIIAIFAIKFLFSTKKTFNDYLSKQLSSTYRAKEIEFSEDAFTYNIFNYYSANFAQIKYEDIANVIFKKDTVYIRTVNDHFFGFSRANMNDSEEAALIEILKNSLSKKQFDPTRIPKKDFSSCEEYTFIPERATMNMYPELSATLRTSRRDINFALTRNVINGKKSNPLYIAIIMAVLAVASWVLLFIDIKTSSIINLLIFCSGVFSPCSLVLFYFYFIRKRSTKAAENFEKQEVCITDFFITYKIYNKNGTIRGTRYNFASFTGAAEFKEYILISGPSGTIAIPKAALGNDLEVVRQILYKELREKFRSFPDK